MPDISMISDDSAVRALISRAPGAVRVGTRQALEDGKSYLLVKVKTYPPQRVGSSYVRTNILKKSWSGRVDPATMTAIVGSSGNIAPYNRQVMSRRDQARVHRGRWSTAEDISEQGEPRIVRMFNDRIRAAVEGL